MSEAAPAVFEGHCLTGAEMMRAMQCGESHNLRVSELSMGLGRRTIFARLH